MKNQKPLLAKNIAYYLPLLERYAMRIINDTDAAAQLVLQVLEHQYEIDRLAPSKNLRLALKNDLLNRCHSFRQSTHFKRSPNYVSLQKFLMPPSKDTSN